jgi:hypothetical protein|tara:strand:- start:3275 stop:3448 length:174 start_codon:yes stop_codon:yes gene_type:complete
MKRVGEAAIVGLISRHLKSTRRRIAEYPIAERDSEGNRYWCLTLYRHIIKVAGNNRW